MALKIQTGHPLFGNVKDVDSDSVSFVADDGREMFEVRIGRDDRSIEIRGISPAVVYGVLYSEQLSIEPVASNSVLVRVRPYEGR